jgi:heme/copper-type cytochrome/quinol oxidase subunit 3
VATTKKGSGSRWVTPSTVTCRSSIASSNADWVRGVARLISSTSTTWANTGPVAASGRRAVRDQTGSTIALGLVFVGMIGLLATVKGEEAFK